MKSQSFARSAGTAFALALGLAALPATRAQQAPATTVDPAFQDMDANHDGHLVRSEISPDMTLLRTRFASYDSNQDGTLDAQEFSAARTALQGGGHATGGGTPPASKQHNSANPGG